MNYKVAIILVNFKDYAKKYLAECIESIRQQDYQGQIKIFIVDNATTPETFEFLSNAVPEAELILNKTNDGFAKGNNDAMKLALAQGFNYIALFNLDTVLEPNCISEMVKAFDNTPNLNIQGGKNSPNHPLLKGAGAVQARLMLYDDKDKINSLGNITHFLGFGFGSEYKKKYPIKSKIQNPNFIINAICYPSGAAVMLKSEVLKEVGLFDEEYWMYNEDQDLGWRMWLSGFKCILAPDAVVYHKYEFSKSIKQYYWLERNRLLSILKNYHMATLLLIFPAFIIMELGIVMFSIKTGWFKEKIKISFYFLKPRTWHYLWHARKQAQSLRQVRDKDIVNMFSGEILHQEVEDAKLKLVNPLFNLYWLMVKKIMWW